MTDNDCLGRLAAAIRAVASQVDADAWTTILTPFMRSSGITTPRRAAAFIGQCGEESGFTQLEEDMSYTAHRLVEVWPTRFPNVTVAAPYADEPEKLANHVYAGRDGNGNEASGDGWRFRGGGLLQLTFRAGYTPFASEVGMTPDDAADFVRTQQGAGRSACWVWTRMGMNTLADAWDIRAITLRLNGALTNVARRTELCTHALTAFGGSLPPASPKPAPAGPTDEADALMAAEQDGETFPLT